MKMILSSILLLFAIGYGLLMTSFVNAAALKDFNIIPESTSKGLKGDVTNLWDPKKAWDFREKYNFFWSYYDSQKDKDGNQWDIWASFSTWIFTWDTIILFVSRLARWIANVALVAGAACVIYAGYLYATSVFTGDASGKANEAIKYAAIGIAVITLAYGILRIAIAAFL